MDFLFGADMPLAVRFFFAFVIVLGLIGGTAYLVRRFGADRLGNGSSRGRQPRLAVIDAAAVDGRRRLVLIRRDNVEHLLMIGGPSDVVVETNIQRTAVPREATPARPPAAPTDTLPRAVPLGEGNMWPLQPTAEPAPPPRPQRPPHVEEPVQWHAEPEPPPPPPPPAARPPRLEPRPEPRAVDPLAGLAAELSRQSITQPAEPPTTRPRREREVARLRDPQPERMREPQPERMREPQPERARPTPAAPTPAPQPPAESFGDNADQNLADMAQRLEAALRRPKPAEPRASEPRAPEPAPRPAPIMEPIVAYDPAPAVAMEAPAEVPPPPRLAPRTPAATPAAPAPQRSVYDSLEQEMASLLGRPNPKI